ncbi:hypothetical protein [Clostridium baratii]|uniref:hypothetical protein n=1 Tax=Clostridium baratii TaxID=1561 RepID=UPI00290274F2|nr:hypothetical protein [Clostridium baratii]MDU1053376.1 hypothetical protein [Clostridium baratii]
MKEIESFLNDLKVKVSRRKREIPVKYRLFYRLSQVLMILQYNGHGGVASLNKINVIIKAIDDEDERYSILKFIDDKLDGKLTIQYDPTINRVLIVAYGEKLISIQNSGKFKITEKGKIFIKKIEEQSILQDDIKFLKKVGKKITEKKLNHYLKGIKND